MWLNRFTLIQNLYFLLINQPLPLLYDVKNAIMMLRQSAPLLAASVRLLPTLRPRGRQYAPTSHLSSDSREGGAEEERETRLRIYTRTGDKGQSSLHTALVKYRTVSFNIPRHLTHSKTLDRSVMTFPWSCRVGIL